MGESEEKTMRKKIVFSLVAFVSGLLFAFSNNTVYAETIPDRPPLNGIYDPHHYLSKEVSDKLSSMNWEYSRTEVKPQIAIAIVDSLDGDLETVANNVARNWQVGFSDTNYGMLVLISVKERKIRTEVSNNMGAIIPDSTAKELNDSIKDDFRNEDYSSGILKYLSKVEVIISSSLLESKQEEGKTQNLEGVSPNLGEQIRNSQKEQKSYVKKYGLVGAIIFGISILIFIFIGIKIEKLQKEENEYYEWKKKHPSSSSGSGSISYRSASRSYDSFSSSSSSSSYDSSSSSSSSSSWSGGGFDGGGSSGSW